MPPLTRGPLPARVYWVRRIMVLGTAVLLVFAVGRLLGNGSDGSDSDKAAANLAAETAESTPAVTAPATASQTAQKPKNRKTKPALPAPTGVCDGSDIAVTPQVDQAVAGSPIKVTLQLRTMESEACTWRMAADTLAVAITSGKDEIWSSRDCPKAVATRSVVVRKATTSTVDFTWNAKRSDDSCTKFTNWAMPGWYHVTAAALGGEPSDLQFQLVKPSPATVTKTITPNASPSGRPQTKPSNKPSNRPSGKPSTKPSGAVEPD